VVFKVRSPKGEKGPRLEEPIFRKERDLVQGAALLPDTPEMSYTGDGARIWRKSCRQKGDMERKKGSSKGSSAQSDAVQHRMRRLETISGPPGRGTELRRRRKNVGLGPQTSIKWGGPTPIEKVNA